MTLRECSELVSYVEMDIKSEFQHAEIGCWIAVLFCGWSYATKAGRTIVAFRFETLQLHRIYASHLVGNEASGRVQRKLV